MNKNIERVIFEELIRQADESRPDTPYVDDIGGLYNVIVDGHIDLYKIALAIEDAMRDDNEGNS